MYPMQPPDSCQMPSWWPHLTLPPYKEGKYGDWEIKINNPPMIRSFYRGLIKPDHDNYILKKNGKLWMSTTPMEIESQGVYIHAAHGNVVIGGLGMGITLYNMAIKPNVTNITVYEEDADVINLFEKCSGFDKWACKDKIYLLCDDILDSIPEERPENPVDLLYMDIWSELGDEYAQDNTIDAYNIFNPKITGWWGMEVDFIDYCTDRGVDYSTVTDGTLMGWQEELGMRIVPTDYAKEWIQMANVAAMNIVNM